LITVTFTTEIGQLIIYV